MCSFAWQRTGQIWNIYTAEQSNWKGTFLFLGIILQVHCKNCIEFSQMHNTIFWRDCKAQEFAFCRDSTQTGLTTTVRTVLDRGKDFANLYSPTILPPFPQPGFNKHICRLHACHPGLINMLQTHCKNCLILLWAFSLTVFHHKNTEMQKVVGWHLGNTLASAACLLSCLIHSLYHLIRRMWRCGGEALSPWDRKGGAVLHLLLPWPHSPLRLLRCMRG